MAIIKTENLSFTYPNSQNRALSDVSISIPCGQFVTICGKSGCGKSTLLRHFKPILSPNGKKEGYVLFDGKNIEELSQREHCEKIGFVMQNAHNQIVTDKVWHELAFGLESLSYNTGEIRARVSEMASFFGIESWFYKNTSELSGGQKQLLNLASVMVMQPSVLILDEPTSQLDPIAAQNFLDMLSKINREIGTTIILSEHRLEEAFPISDRVIVMDKGSIIADGKPNEIGEALKDNDMFFALPTPMKVHFSVENDEKCPVTVKDGKNWLNSLSKKVEIKKIQNEYKENTNEDVIVLKDVYFRYEKNLDDVISSLNMKVKKGEFYAIVGGNGTGKTTALNIISSIFKPYRGKVNVLGKVSMLVQNAQTVFSKKSVYEDLLEMTSDKEKIENIISVCEIEDILHRHPYDLSGGETQKAALAKVLLSNSDILLLDEPTKGFDAHYKEIFAKIINKLKENGITVVMVSHDVEFCAKYADRCAMFFNGQIVSEDIPRRFFALKSFYTTSANRMARIIIPDAVTCEDIIYALGGKVNKKVANENKQVIKLSEESEKTKKEKPNIKRILGYIFLALLALTCAFQTMLMPYTEIIAFFEIAGVFYCLCCNKNREVKKPKEKRKINKYSIISLISVLVLIPLTIYYGIYHLGDKKYYFISLVVILEMFVPFFVSFEKKQPKARELVVLSVLCAIAVAGRSAFYTMSHFKPVLALVIISGVCLGSETGFLVGAITAFVSNFFFGQGPWTPWQMFAYGIIGFLAGIIFRNGFSKRKKLPLCIFGFLSAILVYGVIMNTQVLVFMQESVNIKSILASCALGFTFDLIHAVSTFLFLLFLSEPMTEKLERVKTKYGL